MTQESRLKRLEATSGIASEVILAVMPIDWDDDETQAGIARLRQRYSLPKEWSVDVSRDGGCDTERLLFTGDLEAMLKHVAKHSYRIGVPSQECHA
jgi:hypothetical protein